MDLTPGSAGGAPWSGSNPNPRRFVSAGASVNQGAAVRNAVGAGPARSLPPAIARGPEGRNLSPAAPDGYAISWRFGLATSVSLGTVPSLLTRSMLFLIAIRRIFCGIPAFFSATD